MKGIIFPPRLVSPLPPQCVSGGVVKYTIYIPEKVKFSEYIFKHYGKSLDVGTS